MRSLAVVALVFLCITASAAVQPWLAHSPSTGPLTSLTPATGATAISDKDALHAGPLPDTSAFFFGGGLALLIALLAWGEQIRAITRDTRDLERDFLQITGLTRAELNALLQAENDNDRLVAFTNIMGSGKLTTAPQVEILPLFERWKALGTKLQWLQSRKYWLTILITVVFLATGVLDAVVQDPPVSLLLLLILPGLSVLILLAVVIAAGIVEQRLNALLLRIAEKV